MEFLTQLAGSGLLGLLLTIAILAIVFLYRENKNLSNICVELANKRVEDLKEAQRSYSSVLDANTKIAENTYTIVQNLQQLLNNIKQT